MAFSPDQVRRRLHTSTGADIPIRDTPGKFSPNAIYSESRASFRIKRGRTRFAATVAVRMRENSFRQKYERHIQPDPLDADRKRKALTAVAAKMARVAYALIKHQTNYRCYFETSLPRESIPLCKAVGTS
jgi:hypothetical protein